MTSASLQLNNMRTCDYPFLVLLVSFPLSSSPVFSKYSVISLSIPFLPHNTVTIPLTLKLLGLYIYVKKYKVKRKNQAISKRSNNKKKNKDKENKEMMEIKVDSLRNEDGKKA